MQPHIRLTKAQTRPVVIVVGDPARAKVLAGMCEKSEELAYNREYRSFDCYHGGQYFTVTSHGVGSAGCAICFEELIQNGAKIIVRAGTAGSLHPETIQQGDCVICCAAAQEDGVSRLYAPRGYPSVADQYVIRTIEDTAKLMDVPVKTGVTLSSDLFYKSPVCNSSLKVFADAKVDIVEMEVATLFVVARVRGIKAGAICCVDGSPFKWTSGDYDPTGSKTTAGKQKMLALAINCAVQMAKEQKW